MTDLALHALRLYEAYEKLPTDRGGKDGPKGKAWQAFVDAKNNALLPEPIDTAQTPYGDVTGPAGAIKYINSLVKDDVQLGLCQSKSDYVWPESKNPLLQRIIREVHEQFGCDDPVNERTNFKYDLDADELDIYEIIMWAEDEYRIEITDDELITIDTVGDLECIVREKAKL